MLARLMARILLVEDDEALARGLVSLLSAAGHAVDVMDSGEGALAIIGSEPYGLVVLDIGLPDMSGFDVLKHLRQLKLNLPVLILTARNQVDDRVRGLDLGADDYLLKPFEPSELSARVRALLRRSQGEGAPIHVIGSLHINRATRTASIDGEVLSLRRREWAVLDSLSAHVGKPVPKERLAAEVFSFDDEVAPNAIELYVGRLRRKLEPNGPQIRTLRGLGYMLDPS